MLDVISEGARGNAVKTVSTSYSIITDTSILDYAVASRSRVIITGDSTIERGVYTTWEHPDVGAPIELEAESTVNGALNTILSEEDFPTDLIEGTYEQINYDQPHIIDDLGLTGFDADDYDTSVYLDMTTSISPSQASGQVTEYFPHASSDYSSPADSSSNKVHRKVYQGKTFNNKQISAGNDTLFQDCVFEGVLYVGSGGGGQATNNVRFEDCTFRGPIVTQVPEKFTLETWKKNVLYFTGENTFNNTFMEETTILAPNFNVNLGNTKILEEDSETSLTGVIVGGVVDIRGNVHVNGTIISMTEPDPDGSWGDAAGLVATNIGYSDENMESGIGGASGTIVIAPDPDRLLPLGMSSRIIMNRDGGAYTEF